MSLDNDKKDDQKKKPEEKKYVQFSKKVVAICVVNLFLIEFYAMWMMYTLCDLSSLSYLITAIAAECLGCVIWYMKNSEAEKKARISADADLEKEKLRYENTSSSNVFESMNNEDMSGDAKG